MKLREIMERARLAQLNPLQLALFPPRPMAWEKLSAHSELCAWRFGMNAECDCKLSELDPWETCEHEASYLQSNGHERQDVCLGCGAELDRKEISC